MHWIYYGLDRVEMLEVWSVLAHDYGLYGIVSRLAGMGFRPRPSLRYATLSDEQRFYYETQTAMAERTGAYSRKIGE